LHRDGADHFDHALQPHTLPVPLPGAPSPAHWVSPDSDSLAGRAVRDDKRGGIPAEIQPIFQRMGLNHEEWLEIVPNFGRRYRYLRAKKIPG